MVGYFSFTNKTPPFIINRQGKPGSKDYFMLVGRIVVFLKNLICLPLNTAPLRKQLLTVLNETRDSVAIWKHLLITLVIVFISGTVTAVFKSITYFYGVVGGIVYYSISIIFPLMVQVRISGKKWYHL